MRHWSQLATRNWRVKPLRTLGALAAIALGTGAVVWVTSSYESVRAATAAHAAEYVGRSSINIASPLGRFSQIPERIVPELRKLPGVATVAPRLDLRLRARPLPRAEADSPDPARRAWSESLPELDFHGIDLQHEFGVRTYRLTAGRMLSDADALACVLESQAAAQMGVGPGDVIRVWPDPGTQPRDLLIVGLFERRRIGQLQKPLALVRLDALQKLAVKTGLVTNIDVVLHDPSRAGVRRAAGPITAAVRRIEPKANITSAEARIRQTEEAQSNVRYVLTLLSSVSLLTALFIILSTLSMGMLERIVQLGLMRCVGMTRAQLACVIGLEVLPVGVVGVVAGVPVGLLLTLLTVWSVPQYIGRFAVSGSGILLAVAGGLATTLIAALIPAAATLSVSPLDAARPRARRPRGLLLGVAGLAAALVFAAQALALDQVRRTPTFLATSVTAVILLYAGFALLGPLAVRFVGSAMVVAAALATRIRSRLLQDQVGHAVWRSAGICCGLMVGLSMIVGLVVFSESVRLAWRFPSHFPEAYVWGLEQMPLDAAHAARIVEQVPGVGAFTLANALNVIVEERPLFMEKLLRSITWFLGVEPDTFFTLLKPVFVEGERDRAIELLKRGGHVLIAKDFADARNKRLGDEVRVYFGNRVHNFKVAGVVESPAIDLAATYFQAQSELRVAAVGSVIGTNADLKRIFDVNGTRLVLFNFNLPPQPPPPDWPPPRGTTAPAGLPEEYYDAAIPLAQRWDMLRQDRVIAELRRRLDAQNAFGGTVRELARAIERELNSMTRLLTAVPTVALIVAAIGVANLMNANVASRMKQLAILRAVGATRGQVLRMVIGEALVLGLLGSALGLALGLALARNIVIMTERMYGLEVPFEMPWVHVLAAVGLTIGLCVVAGIVPARHASRTNVVEALHTV